MIDGFYRIGQASKELGVSSYHLRRLCQAGMIEAELTAGNQWRVPISEVTRLQSEGVPPIPQILDGRTGEAEDDGPTNRNDRLPRSDIYSSPSEDVLEAANDVAITESRLRKRRLERELELEEDFFRERIARDQAAAEGERERARKEQARTVRRAWEDKWIAHALGVVRHSAPREFELEVHAQVMEVLGKLEPSQPQSMVVRLVEAAVEKALTPWRVRLDQQRAVEAAVDSLPFEVRGLPKYSGVKSQAERLAAAAVAGCSLAGGYNSPVRAAKEAVRPIVDAFEHAKRCEQVIAWTSVRGATTSERQEARDLVKETLDKLPVGSSQAHLESARDQALAPIVSRIAERNRVEAQKAAEQQKRRSAEWRIDLHLDHIGRYLSEEYEYEQGHIGINERFADARRLKEKIRPALIAEYIGKPSLDDEDIRSRIEELVDEFI